MQRKKNKNRGSCLHVLAITMYAGISLLVGRALNLTADELSYLLAIDL